MVDTFRLLPRHGVRRIQRDRAEYTIALLALNREALVAARRNVYGNYRARLGEYRRIRDDGAECRQLTRFKNELLQNPHPTVWREMQRQHELRDLKGLFEAVPEALNW